MPDGAEIVHGSCLCSAVRWRARGPLSLMNHCHCSMCRKSHGSAFATYVAAPGEGFVWEAGQDLVVRYASSEHGVRCFCMRCGSIVPDAVDGAWAEQVDRSGTAEPAQMAWMPAGCLHEDPGVRPIAHIFVASKAIWYEISDSLPRFDAYPPGYGYGAPAAARSTVPASEPGWVAGSCLCGAIAFEIGVGGWTLMQCHCSRCRKARSSAHGTNLFVPAQRMRWLRGKDVRSAYKVAEAERFAQAFCPTCGSKVPRDAGAMNVVPAGALDGDPGIVERKHIFTDSRAAWFSITDSYPQFPALPPR